jgi:hypothetical protein
LLVVSKVVTARTGWLSLAAKLFIGLPFTVLCDAVIVHPPLAQTKKRISTGTSISLA